ncbi:MAG: helix-turn-helix domain-containing protein [Oscillospiraceae bacterium]|nr:helix-turn-helix domain-containing protein [Oscillospiraceae bacterium]
MNKKTNKTKLDKIQIGKRIIRIRKKLNMNQSKFATFCNISKQTLSNIELGKNKVTVNVLIKICTATGISLDYILQPKVYKENQAEYEKLTKSLSKYSKDELENALKIIIDAFTF